MARGSGYGLNPMPVLPDLSPSELSVLHVLADGTAWVTADISAVLTVERGVDVATSTVTVALRKLRERGMVDGVECGAGRTRRMAWRLSEHLD